MDLDIRLPIAFLFVLVGGLLLGYGILGPLPSGIIDPGFNVNLAWGAVMTFFGAILLIAARVSRRRK